jgi:hypothetical protein
VLRQNGVDPRAIDNEPACAVGPNLQTVNAVRLKAVPEQQILNISNQVDDAQVSTTFFTGPRRLSTGSTSCGWRTAPPRA